MHLFKVDLKPKYLSKAPGTLAGSKPFLPPIVLRHDMAHFNPHDSVHTIYACTITINQNILLMYKPIVFRFSVEPCLLKILTLF